MPDAGYVVEFLDERHERGSFSCGVEALDRYLKVQAGQDARRQVAVTFVLVERETSSVAGFYTLANTAINVEYLPEDIVRKLPRYPLIPATLLGRLAIDLRHRRKGLGEFLLMDALNNSLKASQQVGSFAVVVDAKDAAARDFYLRYHFIQFAGIPKRLFLPMKTIARMLE